LKNFNLEGHIPQNHLLRGINIYMTPDYLRSHRERKKIVVLFAHLKRILKLDKIRLRGLSGAQDEFLPVATAQNLRRMAKWLAPETQEANLVPA
jgi:hypothetical protein